MDNEKLTEALCAIGCCFLTVFFTFIVLGAI